VLTLRQSLLAGLALVLLVALLPAAAWLDRRVGRELESRARADLALAPMRLDDRAATRGDALMMHAKELAAVAGLAAAISADPARAIALANGAPLPSAERRILTDAGGRSITGPQPTQAMIDATRAGGMPVGFIGEDSALYQVSVAPVMDGGEMRGIAGVALPFDQDAASTLAGLTAADVVLVGAGGRVVATTVDDGVAAALAPLATGTAGATVGSEPRQHDVGGARWWTTVEPLDDVGYAVFALSAEETLAVLPQLRRGALLAGLLAAVLALGLGSIAAAAIARPVVKLAAAADQVAQGRFDAPLPPPRLRELARMNRAFERMRGALAARLRELHGANDQLRAERERLQALQSELIQRDRLTVAGRLVTELAHEIRNPVANVRNCLEVIRRATRDRADVARFADLAVDELLRMHELAEQMLDLNRPIDPGASRCDPEDVVLRTADVLGAGEAGSRWPTDVSGAAPAEVAIAPDVLKQVLLSLAQNAREAMPDGGRVAIRLRADGGRVDIDVEDEGPGIPEDVLSRVFDPFFTTKSAVQGVGLGLFIAEGLVRRSGGRVIAGNRDDGAGARFRVELPCARGGVVRRALHAPDQPAGGAA
jgi:signal transduction histidine kinase